MTDHHGGDHHGGLPIRHVWIAAAVGGVVLVVGLAVAIGTAGGSKPHRSSTAAAPATSTSAARVSPPVSSGPSAPSGAPGASARPVVRWSGGLSVNGPDADRDLDVVPPRTSTQEGDVTGSTFDTTLVAAGSGVQLAVVSGSPGYGKCRDAAAGNGSDRTEQPVKAGDVVCVLTSQGRVARLRVSKAAESFPAATVRVNVVVWDPPLPHN